jgi:deoxyuridine 5'-triphosphate nucleotidohydrolase
MSHIDAEGRRRSDRQSGTKPQPPPASQSTPQTPMLTNQRNPIDHITRSNPSPSNADLSYSTTNETVSPSNNLFVPDSTTTSNISEIPVQTTAHLQHPSLYNTHSIQGTTVNPNLQHLPSQTSFIPSVYNPYVPQFSQSFPQSQTHFNSIPFQHQHPYHPNHQINQASNPHPHPTTQMTDPFTTAQLRAIDERMQALETRLIDGITNTIMTKLHQQQSTTSSVTTVHNNTTPDLIDMTSTEPTEPITHTSTAMPTFAIPPSQPSNMPTPVTSSTLPSIPTSTSTPFVSSSPPSSISLNELAQIMSAPKEVTRPLSFPTFKATADYHHWKQLCILKAHKHPSGKDMTIKVNNRLIFNPHMTEEISSTLFLLTTDALGSNELIKLYGSIDIEKADGVALWKVLDKTHMSLDMSAINKEMLSKEFNELIREANETYHAFGIRFEKKKTHLLTNKVPITSDPEQLALKLLLSLNEPIINQNICLNLSKHPEFYVGLTTNGIIEKAETYVKHYHLINKTKPPQSQHPSPPKKENAKDTKPKERGNDKKDATPDPPPLSEKDKMVKLLRNANDLDSYLKGLKRNDPVKFNSTAMKQACSELNKYCLYMSLIEQSPAPTPSPAPAPTPSPAPVQRPPQAPTSQPAARLAVQSSSTQQMINAQVQQAIQNALGDQGTHLIQQLRMANATEPAPSNTEDNSNNNDQVNSYLHIPLTSIMSNLFSIYCILHICMLLFQIERNSIPKCNKAIITNNHTTPTVPSSPTIHYRAVVDSGATHTMTSALSLFESITYYDINDSQPTVTLGDESTHLRIKGYGLMSYSLGGYKIRSQGLYIPDLGDTTLLSVKQHMRYNGNYFHAESNNAMLAFPSFTIPLSTINEIETTISPVSTNQYDFDELTATESTASAETNSIHLVSNKIANFLPTPNQHSNFTDTVNVQLISPTATLPQQATKGAAGFDVTTAQAITIAAGEIGRIGTGLSISMPNSMYLRIAPRSSLSLRHLTIEGGVIDSDYRGEVKVLMKNHNDFPITFSAGDRIAQFIFEKNSIPCIQTTPKLDTTQRGEQGFGSTGTQSLRYSRLGSTFRIDENYILLQNFSNPFRPRARRVHSPIQHPTVQPTSLPLLNKDKANPELTPIITHDLQNTESAPVSPIFNMDTESAPTSTAIVLYQPDRTEEPSTTSTTPLNHHETTTITTYNSAPNETTALVPTSNATESSHDHTAIIPMPTQPIDIVNHALPKRIQMSREDLHRSIGFQNPNLLIKNMHKLGLKDTVQVQNMPRVAHLDPGEVASITSNRRNKVPSLRPKSYGEVWHMDIGYGPEQSIGGIKYTLLLVDKYSRYKFIYGLKNLTTSLTEAISKFINDCGTKPTLIRTDFDYKLMGGSVRKILTDHKVQVESAPPYRQSQNGLVERHWQTLVNMARNWLTSSQLPSTYWYFAVKRACEVSNIMPTQINSTLTTPYELVYNRKVDYRCLIPIFCTSYIKQHRETGGTHKNKWLNKTLKCILVGKCPLSDSLLFYHPPSKQTLSCAEGYRFDTSTPAGPQFGEQYEGDFIFNTKSALSAIHRPPSHEENETVYYNHDDGSYHPAKVLSVPIEDDTQPYTIQDTVSGDIHEYLGEELLDHDPSATPSNVPTTNATMFPTLPWIGDGEKVTLYLPTIMPRPQQGKLQYNADTESWQFNPGRVKKRDPIPLPNFDTLAPSMVDNRKLFKGWVKSATVYTARRVRITSNTLSHIITARKVSASSLNLLEAPTLLKHHKLHPQDKATWDEAYRQEYQGLMDIDTWEMITEEEYNNMKHIFGTLLPTMAISTIKYDGDGKPVRAKYRIVALGNLDPHDWSKNDCFAPVLSQLELRLITAMAVRDKRIPKTGDITQAFCQSYLPAGEDYICRPPVGCPITPSKVYLKLKKTLYGLKRSPRHFYELAVKTLLSIGLRQHENSPCLFYGTIIKGQPPIYLGLYVDDFIYYSQSDEVEKQFEADFQSKLDMELSGQVSHFLGINFKTKKHQDGHVSILLSQEAFIETLTTLAGLDGDGVNEPRTPYRSGFPVDKIPEEQYEEHTQHKMNHLLRVLVGSLNWLALSTRPDIATITNMLAKYSNNASKGHIEQAKRVIKYLKGTKAMGISFTSYDRENLSSFVKFPIDSSSITCLTDANWGPQDQSKPNPAQNEEIDLFKSRSISGYLIWFGGPLHWVSKRQTITARSSAEAEIYATDECTKQLIHLSFLIKGFHLINDIMKPPTAIYNDNAACVNWSKSKTTKGLRHLQMRENAVRESIENDFITVRHISGKHNLADLFTKEDKDAEHFILLRNFILSDTLETRHELNSSNNIVISNGSIEPDVSQLNASTLGQSQGGC